MDTYRGSANITDVVFVSICTFRHGFTAIITDMRPFSGFMVTDRETTFIAGVIPIGIFTTACTIRTADFTKMITVTGCIAAQTLSVGFPFGIEHLRVGGSGSNLRNGHRSVFIRIPTGKIMSFAHRLRQSPYAFQYRIKQRYFLCKHTAHQLIANRKMALEPFDQCCPVDQTIAVKNIIARLAQIGGSEAHHFHDFRRCQRGIVIQCQRRHGCDDRRGIGSSAACHIFVSRVMAHTHQFLSGRNNEYR